MAIPNGSGNQLNDLIKNNIPDIKYQSPSGATPIGGFIKPVAPVVKPTVQTPVVPNQSIGQFTGIHNNFLPFPGDENAVQQPVVKNPTNPGTLSSSNARKEFDYNNNRLNSYQTESDPYMDYLMNRYNMSQQPSDVSIEEKNAGARSGRDKLAAEKTYGNYRAGLESIGLQSGLSRYAPGLQADRLANADISELNKLSEIQDREDLAMAKAKQARMDKDAKSLNDAIKEINNYRQEKAKMLISQRSSDAAMAKNLATYTFKELEQIPDEQRDAFIQYVADQNGISPQALSAALASEEDSQKKFNLSLALQQKALNKSSSGSSDKLTQWEYKIQGAKELSSIIDETVDQNGKITPDQFKSYRKQFVSEGLGDASEFNEMFADYVYIGKVAKGIKYKLEDYGIEE